MANKVMLLGRIGIKPELKYSPSGNAYSELRVALNSKQKQGESYIDKVDWITVKIFGKTAENCVKYLDKGRQVFIEAKLSTNNYIDKEGKKVYSLDVIGEKVEFVGGDKTELSTVEDQIVVEKKLPQVTSKQFNFDDMEVPF